MGGVMAGAMGLGIVITLKDQVSKGLDYIKSKVLGLQGATQEMVDRFAVGAKHMSIGLGMVGAGAMVLAKTFSAPLAAAQQFQGGLAEVGTLVEGNTIQMKILGDNAMALSNKYGKSTQEMLSATYQAISAGVAVNDSAKSLDAAGMMAIGGVTDIKTATDGLTSAMKAYGRGIEDVWDISDSFFTAMKYGKTTVGELSGVIGQVASGAATAGIKFDELMASIAAATLTGQSTSEAATGIRAAIKAMVAPSSQATKLAKELGLQFDEAALKTKGLNGMFKEMMEKTGGSQEKLTTLLGSSEAMAAMMNAMAQGGKNFDMILDEMAKKSGATATAFKTVSETFEFQKSKMLAGLETLKVRFGTVILPVVTAITTALTKLIEILNGLPRPVFTVLAALAGLVGVALILGGAIMTIAAAMKMWELSWVFLKLKAGLAMTSIKAGLAGVRAATTAAMLPMLKWAAIAALVYVSWKSNFMGIKDAAWAISEGFKMAVRASKDGIVEVDAATANALKKTGVWDYAVMMGKVFFRARKFCTGFAQGFTDMVNGVKAGWNALSSAMLPVLNTGRALLNALGLLDSTAKSNSDTWASWGYALGTLAPIILTVLAAIKAFAIAKSIFMDVSAAITIMNAAAYANPIGAAFAIAIGVLTVFMMHWDAIMAAFNNFVNWFSETFPGVADIIESCLVAPIKAVFGWVEKVWAGMQKILGFGGATGAAPDATPQAGITAGTPIDKNNGKAAWKAPVGRKTPAAAALAGHQKTVTQQTGAAVAAAQAQNPPVVKNNVDVSIAPQPVTLTVDGKQLGKTVAKYNANERKREGKG